MSIIEQRKLADLLGNFITENSQLISKVTEDLEELVFASPLDFLPLLAAIILST